MFRCPRCGTVINHYLLFVRCPECGYWATTEEYTKALTRRKDHGREREKSKKKRKRVNAKI